MLLALPSPFCQKELKHWQYLRSFFVFLCCCVCSPLLPSSSFVFGPYPTVLSAYSWVCAQDHSFFIIFCCCCWGHCELQPFIVVLLLKNVSTNCTIFSMCLVLQWLWELWILIYDSIQCPLLYVSVFKEIIAAVATQSKMWIMIAIQYIFKYRDLCILIVWLRF